MCAPHFVEHSECGSGFPNYYTKLIPYITMFPGLLTKVREFLDLFEISVVNCDALIFRFANLQYIGLY